MKKAVIFSLCIAISLLAAMSASADMIVITGSVDDMIPYGGHYTGPIEANLNTVGISGGMTCLDYTAVTYVPNSGYDVHVSRLSPVVDLASANFVTDAQYTSVDLFRYQEAAWLLGQMAANPTEIGQIQYAIWRIFDTTALSGADVNGENAWMAAAAGIDVNLYDFSSVRIYTPTDTSNQEFMSGMAVPVPVPPAVWLLGSGLLGLVGLRRRLGK